jgi:hypothetical protein
VLDTPRRSDDGTNGRDSRESATLDISSLIRKQSRRLPVCVWRSGRESDHPRTAQNIEAIIEAGGCSLDRGVKVTVFMSNIEDFAKLNEVYRSYFPTNLPARSCVEVKSLAHEGLEVEIKCVAALYDTQVESCV